ncbi:MAG: MFS transporter [Deltaproteobacteria bacterium]|nr:MFS transporter [Deltaproteobacteria bacterium]
MDTSHRGLSALIGSSVAIFWPGAFIFGFPGVMAGYWRDSFGVGQGAIGGVMFFVLAAVGVFMFFVGKWQEKLGIRNMITIGAILCGLNVLVLLLANNIFWIYLWAFINGAASCFVYIPALTTVQRWFPQRRGLVSGIVNLMFGLSAAIMSPLFGILIQSFGYVGMVQILGPLSFVTGVLAAQFTGAPTVDSFSNRPSVSGAPGGPSSATISSRQVIKMRTFRVLWLVWALQGAAGIAMVTLSTSYGLARGYTMESAVIILTAFNLANGLSRLISGYLSDRIGRKFTMSSTFIVAAFAYFLLPSTESLLILALLAIAIGFAFGSLFAVSAPLVTDCFGINNFGAVFGLVFTAYGFLAGPLGSALSGYMLDYTHGNYAPVFGYLGCFCLISSGLIWLVKPVNSK